MEKPYHASLANSSSASLYHYRSGTSSNRNLKASPLHHLWLWHHCQNRLQKPQLFGHQTYSQLVVCQTISIDQVCWAKLEQMDFHNSQLPKMQRFKPKKTKLAWINHWLDLQLNVSTQSMHYFSETKQREGTYCHQTQWSILHWHKGNQRIQDMKTTYTFKMYPLANDAKAAF